MSARDDYPKSASNAAFYAADFPGSLPSEADLMLNEIDYLRRWQLEMIAVVAEWEEVWQRAGRPGELGHSKAAGLYSLLESQDLIV